MYIHYYTHHVLLNFQKRTSRALPLLSTRWSKTKVLPSLTLLEPGHRSVLPNTYPATIKHECTKKNRFSCIKQTFYCTSYFLPFFIWVQGETVRGQGSSGLTWRSIECCCPHSYHILATYTLMHLQTYHHNRM